MKHINVKHCQRCGKDHDQLAFRKLRNPADNFTYWSMCPELDQPILLRITGEAEPAKVRLTKECENLAARAKDGKGAA